MDTQPQKERILRQKKNELRQADLIVLVLLILVCAAWILLTLRIPQYGETHTWPGLLPMVLLCGLVAMAGGMLLFLYVPCPEFRDMRGLFYRARRALLDVGVFHRGLLTLAILFVYIFGLLSYLPDFLPPAYSYVISTAVFIFTQISVFRAAPVWLAVLVSALTTTGLYTLFGEFYRVPLP